MRIFDNFNSGFIYGFIAAGIIGLFLDLIREARGKIGQQHRTLDTFSDSEQPKLTAAKIVRSSELGTLGLYLLDSFPYRNELRIMVSRRGHKGLQHIRIRERVT